MLAAVAVIGVLGVTATGCVYAAHLTYHHAGPIRADGVGYYLYLPAVLIDHDPTMRSVLSRPFPGSEATRGAFQREPNGGYLDQYGVGEAILMAPFFGAGELMALATGSPRDGFSWPFQAAAAAAGLTYALIGLLVLGSLLRLWFDTRVTVLTLIAITFGTDLFSYATYDATFSHAYSFALVAVVARLAVAVWRGPRAVTAGALGLALGLLTAVRPTSLAVVLFCALPGVRRPADVRMRVSALARNGGLVLLAVAAFALAVAPQLAYWHAVTGHFVTNPYPPSSGRLQLLHPHLFGVLLSPRKGLFFWSPLLVIATLGLLSLRSTVRDLFLPAVVYLVVEIWIVSSWSIWWYGSSFGMRAMIEALPVFALGLAALVDRCRGLVPRVAVETAIVLTVLVSVHSMLGYWGGSIPPDHTTLHTFLGTF